MFTEPSSRKKGIKSIRKGSFQLHTFLNLYDIDFRLILKHSKVIPLTGYILMTHFFLEKKKLCPQQRHNFSTEDGWQNHVLRLILYTGFDKIFI